MSDYDFRPGGSLKLKSGVVEGGVSKKKKKKQKLKVEKADKEASSTRENNSRDSDLEEGSSKKDRRSPSASGGDNKTDAERRFEEVQRRRMAERVKKLAAQTHKDRVHQFNSKLEALSEHHDIPKVGPG